ncbi:hypothetical protein FB446DRAFT_822913 [Lentinula raphanica]|nr:hypothetical protein FB446DRAFT_822913 [Lentinula raphanica]
MEAPGESQPSTLQQLEQSAAVVAARSSTTRPLKEEKTEPYYPDDSRKAPGPSLGELAQFGVKVRDFAYESKLPPVRPYVRPKSPPPQLPFPQQRQPTPPSHRLWLAKLAAVRGGGGLGGDIGDEGLFGITTPDVGSSMSLSGLTRQRVVQGFDELEQSQQSNYSSSSHSHSLPPLEYITSRESEPYIDTPVVTPNGSLQWKDINRIPINQLDDAARISAIDVAEPKPLPGRSLSSKSNLLASPEPSAAELTLPSLHSPIPTTRTASEAADSDSSRPAKRRRVTPPESPSPAQRRATSSKSASPSRNQDDNSPSTSALPLQLSPSSMPQPPISSHTLYGPHSIRTRSQHPSASFTYNLNSLTKRLVRESFPDLYRTLNEWIALDHTDNHLSSFQPHFATYHNLPVTALHGRSKRHHRSLAWTMLHNAIVGPVSTDHPYFKAFVKGFLLPCKPIGLDLSKVAAFCNGGASHFVLSLLDSRITGNYEALRLEYTDRTCVATRTALRDAYETVPEIEGSFDDAVTLEGASETGYRMRMFCWASTGVPHILNDGMSIEVILVDDTDSMYFSTESHRENERMRLLNHGTISFKTCTRMVQIPASYLLKLLNLSHENGSELRYDIKDTVFHWLLSQIFSNIGSYNVV